MAEGGAKGGRDLVAQYAGHLANLLNGNDHLPAGTPTVEIRAFQLYDRVARGLSANRRYVEGLVGLWAYPPPPDAEQAADFYFDAVLDRPIGRRPGKPSSADNLRALIQAAAVGPGPAPREEELSTWKAMVNGPTRIRRFLEKTALFELSNRILKCLDAANRPYAEVLRLGLCPRDWLAGDEEVGVNTLKAANAFLKALRTAMNDEVGRRPTPAELAAAFAAAPVPGFPDADAFAKAPLGSAVLTRVAGQDITRMVSYEDVEAFVSETLEDEDDAPLVTEEEALPLLERAVRAGAVAADERNLLAAILEGRPLADAMKTDLGLRRRLKNEWDGDLAAYVSDLSARVAAFVRKEAAGRP
ncbi:hypothetical protein [Oharaeibacter diazotrophicus]|uniref:Uncharacterized protein n=1 Tax=Oharaeibacter diazotrophicus TaxID=1920512 RepID=A0A4R6RNV1_9HYPH|nr:hypothetical protein [Oharaeibacter diazotrophicus]TDP87506.1 hypothetical protein EDD54_1402 [Oharaeibacter diazotrophicus]BBE70550.1 hypothetical protein OHA_1_00114 [Pleomorphomonas sp. SM30]GLS77297.1 hypothetical protein GCM10007904_26340 [Oharaeibacter diazotrophicus]